MFDSVVKNAVSLVQTREERDALDILETGYGAIMTARVVRAEVEVRGNDICIKDKSVCITDYERIFFIGIGKCAVDASHVFEDLLGERITDGIVLDVKSGTFDRLRSFVGTHPFPSEANITGTKAVVDMLGGITERDLVLIVVSGGGSSLLCLPHDMGCETVESIVAALWREGATIDEVNTVRKHISDIHGGQLARLAYPATVLAFIISDVPGNDISVVASGPTVLDPTTLADAQAIMERYDVLKTCALPGCSLVETPKDPKYFEKVLNVLLVTNAVALEAMKKRAEELGYRSEIRELSLKGDADEIGRNFATMEIPPGTCLLYGGEVTVKIRGRGSGGRNQELALAALETVRDGRVVVAAAADGWDNSTNAGAIASVAKRAHASQRGYDIRHHLDTNDSYRFWSGIGGGIVTGKTGTNVADLYLVLRR